MNGNTQAEEPRWIQLALFETSGARFAYLVPAEHVEGENWTTAYFGSPGSGDPDRDRPDAGDSAVAAGGADGVAAPQDGGTG